MGRQMVRITAGDLFAIPLAMIHLPGRRADHGLLLAPCHYHFVHPKKRDGQKNPANSFREWSYWARRSDGKLISVRLMPNMASGNELRCAAEDGQGTLSTLGANVLKWIA